MVAAPGVTRFVGAGALRMRWKLPTKWQKSVSVIIRPSRSQHGTSKDLFGIDIRKVVETGITPIINTGIAHKEAGVGQVGAGTVRAPLGCLKMP